MNNWYSRFFTRLLNTTVLILSDHHISEEFRMQTWPPKIQNGFYPWFMGKIFHTVSNTGAVGDDNTVWWRTEQHVPRRIPPKKHECETMRLCVVCIKHDKKKILYYCQDCNVALWMGDGFEALHSYKLKKIIMKIKKDDV